MLISRLKEEFRFTVIAAEFENPCPDEVRYIHVPVPRRPLALLFVAFHIVAPLVYAFGVDRHRRKTAIRQLVESNVLVGDIAYVQFVHRAFLRHAWRLPGVAPSGIRGRLRWLDHKLHSLMEPWVFRRVSSFVVPSSGLQRELETEYPFVRGKTRVINNPVNIEGMIRVGGFDTAALRFRWDLRETEIVLAFVALGHFERKGLRLVLESLRLVPGNIKLMVVGGEPSHLREYSRIAENLGVRQRVVFVGETRDVRPFLWASDAFIFPSAFEGFSLACLEAAAASLPIIATRVHGVEEMLIDGVNGFEVERDPESIAEGIGKFVSLATPDRLLMSKAARQSVQPFGIEAFVEKWKALYCEQIQ